MSESAVVAVPERAGPSGATAGPARRWWILGVVGLAQLMVVLDATIVNIALPSAQRALGFSNADRQWVVTAYSLAFGGLLLLGGRLSDLVGRRRMLIIGLVGFAAASALGGTATGFATLVIGRGLQGAFGAMLAPAALSTLTVTFTDPAERGKAFGVYGAIAGAGGAVGLLLGGLLTEYLSWRWCLYVNVVLAVIAVTGAVRLLAAHPRDPGVHIDWPGTFLVVAGLVAVVYGLSEADTAGWGAPSTLTLLAAGVVLLAVFVLVERRVSHPLLPLRIVLNRFRGGAYLAIGLSAIGVFGIFLFLTYYLQLTLAYSPVKSGLAFLPMIAAIVAASTTSSGVLMPRVGPRPLVPAGMLIAAGGLSMLAAQLGMSTRYLDWILPALLLVGAGLGVVFGCALNTATYGTGAADAGVASALVNTNQQVGGSIGTALLNTLAASAVTSYVLTHGHGPLALAGAAVHSYVVAFWVSAAILAGSAVVCRLVLPSGTLAAAARPSAPPAARPREKMSAREPRAVLPSYPAHPCLARPLPAPARPPRRTARARRDHRVGGLRRRRQRRRPGRGRPARPALPAAGHHVRGPHRRARAVRRAADGGGDQGHPGTPAAGPLHPGDAGRAHPVAAVHPPP
jgi:EmrB/QacA subfamily drug resistance transporter